ncbi:MAG: hypothetical protein IPJ43_17740 [Saprospiraceae bacterium]|nr:hypothetical protein [Saprospiraceae bacterium]
MKTKKNIQPYTTEVESSTIDKISHKENLYDDYKTEVLMPHKMSTLGPCLAVGDVNGDKLEDFYLGGSVGFEGQIFYKIKMVNSILKMVHGSRIKLVKIQML